MPQLVAAQPARTAAPATPNYAPVGTELFTTAAPKQLDLPALDYGTALKQVEPPKPLVAAAKPVEPTRVVAKPYVPPAGLELFAAGPPQLPSPPVASELDFSNVRIPAKQPKPFVAAAAPVAHDAASAGGCAGGALRTSTCSPTGCREAPVCLQVGQPGCGFASREREAGARCVCGSSAGQQTNVRFGGAGAIEYIQVPFRRHDRQRANDDRRQRRAFGLCHGGKRDGVDDARWHLGAVWLQWPRWPM